MPKATAIPAAITRWVPVVRDVVNADEIRTSLVLAMLWKESSGDPYAQRYEPYYQYFCTKNGVPLYRKSMNWQQNRATALATLGPLEFHMQSTSHGLMQIMGAVARERGLEGWIAQLYDPKASVRIGVSHLKVKIKEAGSLHGGIERYNGVGDAAAEYARDVLAKEKLIVQSGY